MTDKAPHTDTSCTADSEDVTDDHAKDVDVHGDDSDSEQRLVMDDSTQASQKSGSGISASQASTSTAATFSAKDVSEEKGSKPKGKERMRHKNLDKTNLICGVCGDKATGFHFDAITCESCKAFFRRRAQKETEPCTNGNKCKMDPINRKFCVDCRLKKCMAIGMKVERILDDETRAKRKKPVRKPSVGAGDNVSNDANKSMPAIDTPPQPLTPAQEEEIDKILRNHALIDIPGGTVDPNVVANTKTYGTDAAEFRKLTEQPEHAPQLVNMVQGFITRFITFIKSLDGYAQLNLPDRMAVFKSAIMDILALRSAIQYDPDIGGFSIEDCNTGAKKNMQLEFIKMIFGEELYEDHMTFITSFNSAAKWDKPTMILTMLINLFAPDRPVLQNKALVEEAELHHTELLQAYLRSRYALSEANAIYPRLLLKLADVRNYGEISRIAIEQHCIPTSADMEPLLREIFSAEH